MDKKSPETKTVDAYIDSFPPEIRERLTAIRAAIHEAVPEAEERISYQMPTFFDKGVLIHFAAFKDHISIFPTPDGVEAFRDELSVYKSAKGTVHFPHSQPLPLELIARIARQRSTANREADVAKRQAKGQTKGRK